MASSTSMSLLKMCATIFLTPSLTFSTFSTPSVSFFTKSKNFSDVFGSCSNFSAAFSRPNALARSNNDDLLATLNGAYLKDNSINF